LLPRDTVKEALIRVNASSVPPSPVLKPFTRHHSISVERPSSDNTRQNNPTFPTHDDKKYVLEFVVADNGPGIPQHLQKKVFEPFVQVEMRLSKVHEGVGLGLSICRQIITMLGGSIQLESSEGMGTRFTVRVPVGLKDVRPKPAPPTPPPDITEEHGKEEKYGKNNKPRLNGSVLEDDSTLEGKLRILIAEDNPTNRMVIVQMLKLQKFTGSPFLCVRYYICSAY